MCTGVIETAYDAVALLLLVGFVVVLMTINVEVTSAASLSVCSVYKQ